MPRGWLGTLLLAALARSSVACGTDAVGVDACRQIQQARCRQAPACGIPAPNRTSGTDVDACIRFYNDACLHGLSSGMDPGPVSVNACVAAINRAPQMDGGCAVVAAPEVAAECSWLTPAPVADASSAAPAESAVDAQSD